MIENFNKYPKGSEWRKWDLHIHTPCSIHNDYGGNTDSQWEKFISDLENLPKEFKVIGINDYIFLDGYKKILEFKNKERLSNLELILPVIELRVDKFGSVGDEAWKKVNFHVIFSNELDPDTIDQQFLNAIQHNHTLSNKYSNLNFSGVITRCSLDDLGKKIKESSSIDMPSSNTKVAFDNITYSYDTILETLGNSTYLKDRYLTAVGKTEWDYLRWTGSVLDKKTIINKADLIFISSESTEKFCIAKNKLKEQEVNDLLLDCSDAHSFSDAKDSNGKAIKDRIGKCFTWIKADPTFEGLKQIIYEPEHRVYIGEEPPILDKVENNKTRYINSLKINQSNNDYVVDEWFKDIEIPFNKELVAIIGNKGSGKSSIADILGLVGYTHMKAEYFSFLHKNKFLKNHLAEKFIAQIIWESSGASEEMPLNQKVQDEKQSIDSGKPESVRYIPQNYFEQLTNNIEISKFQGILENIIFGYIPDDKKLGQFDFSSLKKYKTGNVNQNIENIKQKINDINREIIELENKKNPDYFKKIKGFIENKNIEINSQKKLLTELPQISNPTMISGQKVENQENKEIANCKAKLTELREEYKVKNNEKIAVSKKIESLKQMRERVRQQKQILNEFFENNEAEAASHGLNIKNILKVCVDYSSIDKLIRNAERQLSDIEPYFKCVEDIENDNTQKDNKSFLWDAKILQGKIDAETKKMSLEQKVFQKYENNKKEIEEKIKKLTGDAETPENDTLSFYEKEKTFLEKELSRQIDKKREERLVLSLDIFCKKSDVLELYNDFKKAVDEKISKNNDLLDDYDIKINSSFNLELSFFGDFLEHINQNKKGTFYGKEEGESKLKDVLENKNLNERSDIKKILEDIIIYLEKDQRDTDNVIGRHITDQVNDLDKFYNFLFSLNYLKPKYELKLGNKTLDKLSPGERGALLLIFYLMIDKENIPLIIDQPEDNLDNESVYNMLSKFIKKAKQNRQIIIVTHNPNLAVGADAEQIIHVSIDKQSRNKFSFFSGSIENPKINKKIVQILEGTKPAFDKRKLKYQGS